VTEPNPGAGPDQAASRWSAPIRDLDVFWPILGVILVVAVVFVASVAHNSMDGVGVAATVTEPPARASQQPAPTTPDPQITATTLLIVQVSSHPSRAAAQLAAMQLTNRGFSVHVLDSDDYRPLNRGFFVVYAGPFPVTSAGRAAAKKVQAKLPGALVRELHAR
jgi:hypothetical protein